MDVPFWPQIVMFGALAVVGLLLVLSMFGRDEDRMPQANLGCGTLFLIAIIVSISSQLGSSKLESDMSRLNTSLKNTQQTLESQAAELAAELAEIRRLLEGMRDAEQEHDGPPSIELPQKAP